ncbi:uncharacterized protein EDB91DRAFT_1123517 [Suillus paluster]|uniref:uncharacterized protein n=1 Tax=Suillus paluster TaxID=48578 RepID=UPI001B865AC1|nr:uncharacterized protein EDB91DRAFT_1123517 [Suillus paluster]KAG1744622.1 hypothetical protein EDB91DRAFT_1123517 [Suillus paluster]
MAMDCPLLVWMLSLNRDVLTEEYDKCFHLVQDCVPHARLPYQPTSIDSFRQLICHMLPLLMMRHRRISRAKWKDCVTSNGKHWIEQGRQRQVINIGLGIKQISVEPKGVSVAAYAESFAHKLTPLEMTFLNPELGDDVVLRRLSILLSLKAAYIKAGWEFRVFKAQLGVQRMGGVMLEESYQCACAFFRGTKES